MSSKQLQVSFEELAHIVGSKKLCLSDTVSWSPGRLSAGRTSETDGASYDLWRQPRYTNGKSSGFPPDSI